MAIKLICHPAETAIVTADHETDIDVINAGGGQGLYAASLVNLAIALNKNDRSTDALSELSDRANRLRESLLRIGLEYDVRTDFESADEITTFLASSALMSDVGNRLVSLHGPRQETIWLISCLVAGAHMSENTATLQPHVRALGDTIGLPDEVITACLDTGLQPLRDWVTGKGVVFIGHGRSPVWRSLKDLLTDRLGLTCVEFNSESPAGVATQDRLEQMLDQSSFAFLVLTAEDGHIDGSKHARENVVHEVGLFQGRLGFKKAIVLLEDGCEEFSNVRGLGQIRFPEDGLLSKSEEIRAVLEREGVI